MHRKKNGKGYWLVYEPDHPFCNSNKYIQESRLIMENHIGRYLMPDEHVHHINHDKTDNRIENLQLMTRSEHMRFEHLGKKASGETKQKLSLMRKGRPGIWAGKKFTEEHRKKIALAGIGRKHTEEAKRKIGLAHIGNTYGRANKGRASPTRGMKHTNETKEKISLAKLGKPNPHKGTPRSEESRQKMSLAKIGNQFARKHRIV